MDLSRRLGTGVAYCLVFGGDGLHCSYFRWSISLGVGVYVYSSLYYPVMRHELRLVSPIPVAPRSVQRPLSYLSGWLSALGWHAFIAAASYATGNIILILAQLGNPSYTPTAW